MAITEIHARALLAMSATTVTRATVHAEAFTRIGAAMGPATALWAYANTGTQPGHRRPCDPKRVLDAWTPTTSDWCRVISGTPGSGKTITSSRYVAERGGLLVNAEHADSWGWDGGKVLRTTKAAAWVLIDDLGDEKTGQGLSNIQALISHRCARGSATVCTTTLALDGDESILSRYGDHTLSRLRAHYHSPDRLEDDLRSTITPVTSGIEREILIARGAASIREIAAGRWVQDASDMVTTFAGLLRIDMAGEAFAAEVGSAEADMMTNEQMDEMAEAFYRKISGTADHRTEAQRAADDDLLAWVDGQS